MFCRRAWQRIGPLARSSFTPPCRNAAPVRHMSFGVPGGSTNMTYVILCGGGLTAAVVYAYKTVRGDSERYEDRLANMGSTAKAAAPAAETSPVNEAEPATEVVAESVPAPAEPEAEIGAEVIIEVVAKDTVAVTSEVDVTEAADEPVVKEEAAPSVVLEAAAEDAPVAEEVEASVETQAEAPAAESVEPMPDLLTAVKILTGSTVEIAAASVGEKRFVNAAQQIEGDGRGLDSTVEVPQPEILEVTAELTAKEAADGVNEEELRSSEAGAVEEVADADDAEEVIAEETSTAAAAEEEEEAAEPPPEEATGTTQTVGEVGEVEAEDEALDSEAATKEAPSSTKASPEDAPPAEEATPPEEATASDEAPPAHDIFMTPAAQTSADEVAAEESAEEMVEAASTRREAAAVVNTTQLAAASTVSNLEVLSAAEAQSDAPLHKAKHCHSCHSAPPAAEEVVPPAAPVGEMCSEGAEDMKLEAKEVALLVEGQSKSV